MKTILRFSYALMVAMMSMFVAACGSDDDGNGTPNVPTQPETPSLSVPVKSYNVAQSGETLKVTLSTNQTGVSVDVAADSKSWIHPSAINTQSFSLTVDKSDEYDTRTGSVTVKAGTLSETITITQQGSVVLTLAKTEYTISDAGGDILIDTESNFKYEVKTNVDWIKEVSNTSRAISKSTITLNVQPNGNYDSRQAIIVLRDPSSQMEKTVTIIQAQKNAIVLSKDSYEFDKVGGKIDVEVASNVEYETKIDCNWITQVSSRALTSKQLSFNVSAMPDGETERAATISFVNSETGIVQRISVKQTNWFSLKEKEITIFEGEAATLTLTNNLPNKNVKWSSSDKSVASVDQNGRISALKKGTTRITVASDDGVHSESCDVTVNSVADGIVLTASYGSSYTSWTGYNYYIKSIVKNNLSEPLLAKTIAAYDGNGNYIAGGDVNKTIASGGELSDYGLSGKTQYSQVKFVWTFTYKNKEYTKEQSLNLDWSYFNK